MADIAEEQPDNSPITHLRVQTEDIAFTPEEMNVCKACVRMNPPNRLKCLYCGHDLDIKPEHAAAIKPNFRKLEAWERGFNVIFREKIDGNQTETAKAAMLLSMEIGDLNTILDAGLPLPVARLESEKEADILITGLAGLGLKCSMVADADLADDKPPVRLSNIEFREMGIAVTDFNTRLVTRIEANDLALIVPGVLSTGKVDSLEKRLRRGRTKLVDETATSSDESILDIYNRHDGTGFRVHLAGFDFSCLGDAKGLLAVENMRLLVVALKEHVPNAKLVSDYTNVRNFLGNVWEVESRKDPRGLKRSGFGKVEFGSVASTSNLRQFTKFSRLQWQLL